MSSSVRLHVFRRLFRRQIRRCSDAVKPAAEALPPVKTMPKHSPMRYVQEEYKENVWASRLAKLFIFVGLPAIFYYNYNSWLYEGFWQNYLDQSERALGNFMFIHKTAIWDGGRGAYLDKFGSIKEFVPLVVIADAGYDLQHVKSWVDFDGFGDGRRIVVVELPGHGDNSSKVRRMSCPMNTELAADHVYNVINNLHEKNAIEDGFVLLGYGWGAAVSLFYRAKYPLKLKGHIMVSPYHPEIMTPRFKKLLEDEPDQAFNFKTPEQGVKFWTTWLGVKNPPSELMFKGILRRKEELYRNLNYFDEWYSTTPLLTEVDEKNLERLQNLKEKINYPVLVCYGENNKLCNMKLAIPWLTELLGNVDLAVFRDCGHFGTTDGETTILKMLGQPMEDYLGKLKV